MGVCPTTRERGSEPLLKSCILCSHGTHKYVQKCARCCEHACEDGVLFRGKGKRAGREGRVGSGGQTNGARLVDVGFHSVIGSLWQMGEEKGENHASSACRTLPVRAVLENCSPDPAAWSHGVWRLNHSDCKVTVGEKMGASGRKGEAYGPQKVPEGGSLARSSNVDDIMVRTAPCTRKGVRSFLV